MSVAGPAAKPRHLGTKLFYGAGSLAFGVKDNGFNVFLLLFYNQVLGLPAGLAGAALAIALVVDALCDPLVGYLSDNTRSRWGRRHPYMYAAAAPAALTYLLLWFPPTGLGQGALLAWLVVITVLVRTFITLYEIPSSALGPELSADYDERTSYMSYRYLFGWLGGVTIQVLALAVFLKPDATHRTGQLNPNGYHTYAMVAAAVMFVSILASSWGTHSAIPRLKAAPPRRGVSARQVLREIGGVLGHRSALVLLLSGVVGGVVTGLGFALQLYLRTYFWRLPSTDISILTIGSYASAIGAMVLSPWVSRRLGKKRALIAVSIASAVLGPLTIVLRLLHLFPETGSPLLVPILLAMSIVTTGLSIMPGILGASMMSDVVEDLEVGTGRRSEGVLFAANAFLLKAVSGFGLLTGALVLSWVRFPQHATPGHVAPEVLDNMAIVYVVLTWALSAVSIAFVAGYRITRESHAANLRELEALAARMAVAEPQLHAPAQP